MQRTVTAKHHSAILTAKLYLHVKKEHVLVLTGTLDTTVNVCTEFPLFRAFFSSLASVRRHAAKIVQSILNPR